MSPKILIMAFEAAAASARNSENPEGINLDSFVSDYMKKNAHLSDPEFDAALQATPEYRKYVESAPPGPESGWDETIAHAQCLQDMIRAGRAIKAELTDKWLREGCPSREGVKSSKPLRLK